jgi:hypothetical protein
MSAKKYDFSIEQGTSFRFSITYKDSDGVPLNLTNYCARLIWTTNDGIVSTFSTQNNDYSQYKFTIDGPNGQLLLLFPAESTNDFNFNTAKYDLELQSPNDVYAGGGKEVVRLLYGIITITKRYSLINTQLDCQ